MLISIHALLAESDSAPRITPTASRNFYPRSPCGERHLLKDQSPRFKIFLSTLSLRRATQQKCRDRKPDINFYPRSPCGERPRVLTAGPWCQLFLSTLSLRRATLRAYQRHFPADISIHALLAESDHYGWSWYDDFTISIHALLAESDHPHPRPYHHRPISIHALLAESDGHIRTHAGLRQYFYPRSPCGERPC